MLITSTPIDVVAAAVQRSIAETPNVVGVALLVGTIRGEPPPERVRTRGDVTVLTVPDCIIRWKQLAFIPNPAHTGSDWTSMVLDLA
jgi:hypothetical protein